MMTKRVIGLALVMACGGSKGTATSPSPANRGREMTTMDPDLSSLAKFAARSLPANNDGRVHFGGVFVGGRPMRALTDTIVRAIGATLEDPSSGRVPYTIGGVGSGVAQGSRADAVYTLRSFRISGDTAFIGSDAKSVAEPTGALCIVLTRSGSSWLVNQKRDVSNPQSCGPLKP
jgi:hypothetical protein